MIKFSNKTIAIFKNSKRKIFQPVCRISISKRDMLKNLLYLFLIFKTCTKTIVSSEKFDAWPSIL